MPFLGINPAFNHVISLTAVGAALAEMINRLADLHVTTAAVLAREDKTTDWEYTRSICQVAFMNLLRNRDKCVNLNQISDEHGVLTYCKVLLSCRDLLSRMRCDRR